MIQNHLLDIFLSVGFAQGLFIAFILWKKKPSNQPAVRHLVSIIVILSLLMLGRASYQPEYFQRFSEIIMLPDAMLFLIGPFLYFFTKALLQLPLPRWKERKWHLIPALFHVLVFNTVIGLHFNGTFKFFDRQQINLLFAFLIVSVIVSLTSYLYLSFRDFRLYQVAWKDRFTTEFPADFLRPFFMFGFLIMSLWAGSFIYELTLESPTYFAYWIMWSLLVIYVFFLGYQVLLKPQLLELPQLKISMDISDAKKEMVEKHMSDEKPYLDPALKIGDLADSLDIPKHELSKIINHSFGKNFFDYLNSHRIREFIQLKNDTRHAHLNISDLAFQSGFNSRTAFNRAFRKETGLTPSEYFKTRPVPSEN